MKLVSDLYNKVASFKQDEKGSIIPLTAIMLTTLGLAAGAAVDYSRYSKAKTIMDTALDAAVLDAGVRLGRGEPVNQEFEDRFNEFFNVNITGRGGFADNFEIVSFSADPVTGKVSASAAAAVDTTLMRIGGFDTMQVASTSGGIFEQNETEVTIMLDVTGSMGNTITGTGIRKIDSLKAAAKSAVRILLEESPGSKNTRVGLVPYSYSVNAGKYANNVTFGNPVFASTNPNINISGVSQDCVTERSGAEAFSDAFYTVEKIGADPRVINPSIISDPYNDGDKNRFSPNALLCPKAKIQPLTNNANMLKNEIENMKAEGTTAGHLGVAWSYYMLSEKWRPLWDNENKPAPYSSDTTKVAILMTDGEFNTFYSDSDPKTEKPWNFSPSSDKVARSNAYAINTCAEMKKSGITVYSIAFDAPSSAEQTLKECATPNSSGKTFFFSASDNAELKAAFEKIASDITSLRLTQ